MDDTEVCGWRSGDRVRWAYATQESGQESGEVLGTVAVVWRADYGDCSVEGPGSPPYPAGFIRWDTELVDGDLVEQHAKEALEPVPTVCPAHPDLVPIESDYESPTGVLGRRFECAVGVCPWSLTTPSLVQEVIETDALWRAGRDHKELAHLAVKALRGLGLASVADHLGRQAAAPSPYVI